MTRTLRIGRRYLRNADRLAIVPGSARGRAVGLWYTLADDQVAIVGVTADPPVPVDE